MRDKDKWIDRWLRLTFFLSSSSLSLTDLESISKWVTFSFYPKTKNPISFLLEEKPVSSFHFQMTYALHKLKKKKKKKICTMVIDTHLTRKEERELNESIKLYISVCLNEKKVDFNPSRQHPHYRRQRRLSFWLSARTNNKSIFSGSECITIREARCETKCTNCRQCFWRKKHALLHMIASRTRFYSLVLVLSREKRMIGKRRRCE